MTFNMTNFFNEAKKNLWQCIYILWYVKTNANLLSIWRIFYDDIQNSRIHNHLKNSFKSLYDSSNTMPLSKFDGIFFGKKLFFSQFVNVNKLKVGLPQKHDDRLCFTPFTFPERIRILNFLLLHDY